MWRKNLITTAALAVLLASTAAAQWWSLETRASGPCVEPSAGAGGDGPFGFLDTKATMGLLFSGQLQLNGWALDDDGVASVDIVVDGRVFARARYGNFRPGVAKLHPNFPDAKRAGFSYTLDTTQFLNGLHQVSALVTSLAGEERLLNVVELDFNNNSHALRPFGKIDFPQTNAELDGNCDLTDPDRRYAVIEGWVLDAGVEINRGGVGYVELMLDGALFANSRTSCRHSTLSGAFSDCYGLPRLDNEHRFPFLKDAPHSGFRFVLDVGFLISGLGYTPGHHFLTIRSGDLDSQVSNVDSIVVTFSCEDFFVNQDGFGEIMSRGSQIKSGNAVIAGWALDREGVRRVDVYVDGLFVGTASFGFPRPEVTSRYPGFIDTALPGWIFNLNTLNLSDGQHVLLIVVVDAEEDPTIIGELKIFIQNS